MPIERSAPRRDAGARVQIAADRGTGCNTEGAAVASRTALRTSRVLAATPLVDLSVIDWPTRDSRARDAIGSARLRGVQRGGRDVALWRGRCLYAATGAGVKLRK